MASAANADAATLDFLALHPNEDVQLAQLYRPMPSAATLTLLVNSKSARVRLRVARLPQTPPAILEQLSLDEAIEVRQSLLANQALTQRLVIQLADDPETAIRRAAVDRLTITDVGSLQVLTRAAADPAPQVRQAATAHPDAPIDVQLRLASDQTNRVRLALTQRAQIATVAIGKLRADHDPLVRRSAADHHRRALQTSLPQDHT